MKPIHFLGILFVVVGYFAFKVFYPFLGTMTIAILLALATYKFHQYFLTKLPGRILPSLASTLVLGVIFFAPLVYIITNAATFVTQIDFGILHQTIANLKEWIEETIKEYHLLNIEEYTANFDINEIINWILQMLSLIHI